MKVYIVHGYTASPDKHWFPWLARELESIGVACERLAMPDSDNPTPEKWVAFLEQHVQMDEKTIIVGHSLGCITWLNFLAKQQLTPAGAILVSGFYQPLHTLPELAPFAEFYAKQPTLTAFPCKVVAALDDHIVPHQYSDALAQHLQADYFRLNHGGHFLDREGWTAFPLVLALLKAWIE